MSSRLSLLERITRIRAPLPDGVYWSVVLATFVLPLVLWVAITSFELVDPLFMPGPAKVVESIARLNESGRLWTDIGMSVFRVGTGFVLAALIAVPIGILIGTYHVADAIFEPLTDFIRYMPAAAFIPLIMLYVGIDEASKILVIFIGTYFQLVLMIAAVARNVQNDVINVAYTLGASQFQVLTRVLVPASLPGILETFRITFGWAWTYVIVAELVAAQSGLGFRIMESQRFLRTDVIFLYIIIIGLLGLLFDQALRWLSKKALPWAETFHS